MKVKKLLILLLLVFGLTFLVNTNVNATTYLTDDGAYNYTTNVKEEKELFSGVNYVYDEGTTQRGSTTYDQQVFMVFADCDEEKGTKLVTWAPYSETGSSTATYYRTTLDKIAVDYEKNHPGWKVIAGINADQYVQLFGTSNFGAYDLFYNQPYYPMMIDGKNVFTTTFLGHSNNTVGFKNDGSTSPFVQGNGSVKGLMVNVYDENNNLIKEIQADSLNPESFTSGTAVYCLTNTSQTNRENDKTTSKDVTSSNDLYIVTGNKGYVSNSTAWAWCKGASAQNAFFGEGNVSLIQKSYTLKINEFAIETTDESLKAALATSGAYVVAQYEWNDEALQNCEAASGYHTIQRLNGVDQNVANTYNSKGYPRSIFGYTSEGKIALITCNGQLNLPNGSKLQGLYAQEANALCKAYDVVTAYQQDGGGSVTMITREEDGSFKTVTTSNDGSTRSILSGMFVVVRDIEVAVTTEEIMESSLTLNVDVKDFGTYKNVAGVYVNLKLAESKGSSYDKIVKVDAEGKVKFEGLSTYTSYQYKIMVQVEGETIYHEALTAGNITTAKKVPSLNNVAISYTDKTLTIRAVTLDGNKAMVGSVGISFDNGESYQSMSNGVFVVQNYEGDPFVDMKIRIRYDISDGKGTQTMEIEDFTFTYDLELFMGTMLYHYNEGVKEFFD